MTNMDASDRWLEEHLNSIRKKIELFAAQLISDEGLSREMAIARATQQFAPGKVFETPMTTEEGPTPFWTRIFDSFTGITLVSAVLAIVFGLLGYLTDHENAQRMLDISKIFAGAVVGSAGASATKATRKGHLT